MVLMGLFSLKGLSIEQYPFLAPPTIRVTATYPGASAVAVEQSVATPIEQEVNGVDKMIYMKSSNTSDGRMQLDVNFEVGVDQDTANVLTQNRVSSAQARLPQEVVAAGSHGQEAEPEHPDADLALLAQGELRRQLSDQLLRHQPARSAAAHPRHRPGRSLRRRRLWHAYLAAPRQAGQARAHAFRCYLRNQGAEPAGARPGASAPRPHRKTRSSPIR